MFGAIEPMPSDHFPTEPGWYAIEKDDQRRDLVLAWRYHHHTSGIDEFVVGSTGEDVKAKSAEAESWSFLARVYLGRI